MESVQEGVDAERVISQLASQGNKIIFTTSFGYMDPTLNVAKKFPGVTFLHCSAALTLLPARSKYNPVKKWLTKSS